MLSVYTKAIVPELPVLSEELPFLCSPNCFWRALQLLCWAMIFSENGKDLSCIWPATEWLTETILLLTVEKGCWISPDSTLVGRELKECSATNGRNEDGSINLEDTLSLFSENTC